VQVEIGCRGNGGIEAEERLKKKGLNSRYEEIRIWFSDFLISGLPGLDYGSHLDYRDRRKNRDQGGGRGTRGSMCCGFGENEGGIFVSLVSF
jgi:hypothetical protein